MRVESVTIEACTELKKDFYLSTGARTKGSFFCEVYSNKPLLPGQIIPRAELSRDKSFSSREVFHPVYNYNG